MQTLYLTYLGGHNLGDTVRRILHNLGTNGVWSAYSFKGKKGKLAFTDLPLCRVVISRCTVLLICYMSVNASLLLKCFALWLILKLFSHIYDCHSYMLASFPKGACLKSYDKAKVSEVEDEIGEALKHAPKRKGGPKYKVRSELHVLCFDIH